MLKVRTYPDAVLSRRAAPVKRIDGEFLGLIREMFGTMYREKGIGLAAPQVGESLQVCVINCTGKKDGELVLINPVIIDSSGEVSDEEGCLSVPGIRSNVTRAEHVKVRGYDQHGNEVEIEADGLQARCLQHELDHLAGRLFVDRLGEAARMAIRPGLKALEEQHKKQA